MDLPLGRPAPEVPGYGDHDQSRWITEVPTLAGRSEFARDRARVLHSAGLRRLAATTQVLAAGELDFPRTRLTHTLEVAQIGRELGAALGCDADLVDVAGLAHDLGHPPFGHNGETALNEAATAIGGFEGNAQTLRVLTRLEAKVLADSGTGRSAGLNLTRASLDAATKYPWPRIEGTAKFGVYDDDREVFDWLRQGAPGRRRCLEAQVMDWADDVAYSVHDLEDAVVAGFLDVRALHDPAEIASIASLALPAYGAGLDEAALTAAGRRLAALPYLPRWYDASLDALVALKGLTSRLIGRFCAAAETATRAQFGDGPLTRYGADLVVPQEARAEVAFLKAVTLRHVMRREGADQIQSDQRGMLGDLVKALAEAGRDAFDPWVQPMMAAAEGAPDSDSARLRVVIDQVASLTDISAPVWHARLCG